jgi:hypothetical protein
MAEDKVCPPTPGLEPAPITLDHYIYLTPEKLELVEGYLVEGPNDHIWRERLLALLLTNEGLLRAVQLAPESAWREALAQVYDQDPKGS